MMSLLRSFAVSVVIVVGYFVLPFRFDRSLPTVALAGGLAVVAALLAWQIVEISRSPYPRIRLIGAVATSMPLFLAVFATTYFLMAGAEPAAFTEPLSRLDSAYYTVTVFATVGFGDVAPVSDPARVVTTIQMLGDLVLLGLVAQALLGAVHLNLDRRK